MTNIFSIEWRRRLVSLFFAYLSIATILSGLLVSRISRSWTISDWLINYEGGFVRRGFAGELVFMMGRLTHTSPIIFVVITYLFFFAVFLFSSWQLALRTSLNFWVIAMLVCPATFSLQLLSPQAGFRKEIIYVAALAALLCFAQRVKLRPLAVGIGLSLFAIVGLLSHEALLFFTPYLVAALFLANHGWADVRKETLVPALLALAIAFICSRHLGSPAIVHDICASIGYGGPNLQPLDICSSGAIPYLIRDPTFARQEVLLGIQQNDFFRLRVLPLLTLLALFPAIQESRALRRAGLSRAVGTIWIVGLISFIFSMMLFVYAVDWGRWLHLHIISITLLLLFVDSRAKYPVNLNFAMRRRPLLWSAGLALYLFTWALPDGADGKGEFGYSERLVSVIRSRGRAVYSKQIDGSPKPPREILTSRSSRPNTGRN